MAEIVRAHGIRLVQRLSNPKVEQADLPRPKGHVVKAARIARQYKFGIESAFSHFSDAKAIIIVEDDLLFSPDWKEYFELAIDQVERDPSVWTASAWNDNGFRDLVKDSARVLRTDHFPGLTWVLLRDLWQAELSEQWPETHWDWFMRNSSVSRGRDCLYPEISRVFHHGWNGTFSNWELHQRYFAGIALHNDQNFRWSSASFLATQERLYDAEIARTLLHDAVHVGHGSQLRRDGETSWQSFSTRVVWHHSDPGKSRVRADLRQAPTDRVDT